MKTTVKHRVYINSYTMKQPSDNDVQFRVDLGRVYQNIQKISLQQLVVENKFMNFYPSTRGDFRDLSFRINGVQKTVFVDRFITINNLSAFIQEKSNINFDIKFSNGTLFGDPTTVIQLSWVQGQDFVPTGFGWTKLGFDFQLGVDKTYQFPAGGKLNADFLPDFGQPPLLLVNVRQFESQQNSVQNRFGQSSFVIPFEAYQFGERIVWNNTNQDSNQHIQFQQPISLQFLDVELQSCDQKIMCTPTNKAGEQNQQDLELIMVLTVEELQ